MNCSECGAAGCQCKARFDEFLVLEFTDAAYGAVHHLTVAAFMLQHSSQLTREGWLQERELLREFLVEKKPPSVIRRKYRHLVDNGRRTFKIKSVDGKPVIHQTIWTKTILDVRSDNAASYCAGITAWADSVLTDAAAMDLEGTWNEIRTLFKPNSRAKPLNRDDSPSG
jgi:hypothetical protein